MTLDGSQTAKLDQALPAFDVLAAYARECYVRLKEQGFTEEAFELLRDHLERSGGVREDEDD
jgi:hypothetical protein